LYEPGTVVVAIYGLEAAGIRGTASIIEKRCTISQACMAFSDFKGIDNEFLYYWYLHMALLLEFVLRREQNNRTSVLK
jgi:type I restriction enzyme S subunit